MIKSGALALVVGPSGAGKDTLLNATRAIIGADPRIVFTRRIITRPAHEASESHDTIAPEDFDAQREKSSFLLAWTAHGHGYAIPASAAESLQAGNVVVANVSRSSIADAEAIAERVVVLHVTAPLEALARRIAGRGRESEAAILDRLARQSPLIARRAEIVDIVNDGRIEDAAQRFAQTLTSLADQTTATGGLSESGRRGAAAGTR